MRKIIQISTTGVANVSSTQCNRITTALCDDGTVWELRDNTQSPCWQQLPPIPQSLEKKKPKMVNLNG